MPARAPTAPGAGPTGLIGLRRFPQHEIGRVFPEATVVELSYHDWKADEFAQGTWAIHRPGWYANHHAAMQEPEGRVILASADIADGWAGFVDGALESGKRGGRWAAAQV